MPKVSDKSKHLCPSCVTQQDLLSHECSAHSTCIDKADGLWYPSRCFSCAKLFQASEKSLDAQRKIIQIASHIKKCTVQKNPSALHIYGNAEEYEKFQHHWLRKATVMNQASDSLTLVNSSLEMNELHPNMQPWPNDLNNLENMTEVTSNLDSDFNVNTPNNNYLLFEASSPQVDFINPPPPPDSSPPSNITDYLEVPGSSSSSEMRNQQAKKILSNISLKSYAMRPFSSI